jgi:hypothetical protein
VKEFSQLLKRRKPNPPKIPGHVVQLSYVCFSLLKTAIFIDGGERPFTGTSGGKWPPNEEEERNYDATCYAYEHSITSWRVS